MYTLYVLKSYKNGKRYVGINSKLLTLRMSWHKWGTTAWTRQNGPFDLVYSEQLEDKQHALRREKYFKTGQGRKTLDSMLEKK